MEIRATSIMRLRLHRCSGSITANPNPILIYDQFADRSPGSSLIGTTQLSWTSRGTEVVEVHVDAPDGPLLSCTGPAGAAPTGRWVSDGMLFYLQNVSGGKPLTSANTLDIVKVSVVHSEDGGANLLGRVLKPLAVRAMSVLPLRLLGRYKEFPPPVGWVRFGTLRRLTPISSVWGFDRGVPIDRYYIEKFLSDRADDIQGRVLEIGNSIYTSRFGRARVSQSDVLNLLEGNPATTIVGDLTCAPQIPSDAFDCIILTQTLQCIYDTRAAIQTLHRILKPGGVLLVTFPGISQTYDKEWGQYWCWNFTILSARLLFEDVFAREHVALETFGNVFTAISFLHGLSTWELRPEELDHRDPGYDLIITVRAVKA
jgi:hypothetical protein